MKFKHLILLLFCSMSVAVSAKMIDVRSHVIRRQSAECLLESYSVSYIEPNNNDRVIYSVCDVTNISDEKVVVFFDNKSDAGDFNVYDFLHDRFLLSAGMSFLQAITESNISVQMDLYQTVMKVLDSNERFSIVSNCNDSISSVLVSQVRVIPMSLILSVKPLNILENLDSWVFDIPDVFYIDKSLICDDNSVANECRQLHSTGEAMEKLKEFLCNYMHFIKNADLGNSNWNDVIAGTEYDECFSSHVKRQYSMMGINYDPLFKDDFCEILELSADERDLSNGYTTLKIKMSYRNRDGIPTTRVFRVQLRDGKILITHIYNL